MKPSRPTLIHAASASALALLASVSSVQAAGGSWNVDNLGNWSTTTNWTPAAVPGTAAGDAVNLQFNITAARTVTIDTTSRTVGDLNIGDPTATLFGYTLASSATTVVLNLDGTGSTAATVDFTAAIGNTISAPLTLVDNAIFRSNVNAVMTLSGVISGASKTVTFNNDTNGTVNAATALQGQFLVTGNNTYNGGTTISDVRVNITTNNTALGAAGSAVTIQNGGQVFASTGLATINYAFNIAGDGWAETTAGQPLGALRLEGGPTVTGNVVMSANAAIGGNGVGTISGVVSGGFTLSKRGTGTTTLSGANTYSGGTTIVNGVLQFNNNAAAGTGLITVSPGAAASNRVLINGGVTLPNDISYGNTTGTAGFGVIQQTGTGQGRANGTITITGSPSSGGHFVGGVNAGSELVLGGPINSTVASLSVREGRVVFSGGGTGGSWNSLIVTNSALVGANNGIPTAVNVSLGGSAHATLDLNGFDQSLSGLTLGNAGAGLNYIATANLGSKTLTLTGPITGQSNTNQNVTHRIVGTTGGAINVGASPVSLTLSDTLAADDLVISNVSVIGSGGLVKDGAGTVSFKGVTLSGPLAVNAGAIATGDGSETGTLTVPSLAFANGTGLRMKAGSDLINGGTVTAVGATVTLSQEAGLLANGTYPLITYTGTTPGLGGFALAPFGHATASLVDTGSAIALQISGNDAVLWDGTFGSAWATGATGNWKLATPLTASDYVDADVTVFPEGPVNSTVGIAANVSPSSVTFANTASAYTLSGAAGIVGSTGLTVSGGGSVTLGTVNRYTGATTVSNGTLNLTGGSLNGTDITVGSGGTFTASGVITGLGKSLTTSGTTTLSGANTYSGDTTVLAGTTTLSGGTLGGVPVTGTPALGSNVVVASGATFTQTAGVIAGINASLTTGGTTTMGGLNTFQGDVFLTGGTLTVAMTNALTGHLGSSPNPSALSKVVNISNNAVFHNTTTFNDNTGSATVLQLIFDIGAGGATFSTDSGTTLTLDDGSALTNANNAAQLRGTGNLTKVGPGTLSLGNSTSNFGGFSGQIFVNEGTLTSGATSTNPFGTTADGTTVASGATLDVKAANIGAEPITVSGTGVGGLGALVSSVTGGSATGPITLVGDTSMGGATALALSGVVSGGFNITKVGAGTMTLSNAGNSYSGSTTIAAGQITASVVGGVPATSNLILAGGTFDPANLTHTFPSISGTAGALNQGAAGTGVIRTVQSGATIYQGSVNRVTAEMAGTGSLTLGGAGDNASGSVTANSGVVVLAKGDTGAVSQAIHAVGTLLTINNGGTVQLAGTYDNVTTPGTAINLAPVGINNAIYGDLIYNAAIVNLNQGGILDLNGRQEAVSNLTHTTELGGTVHNSSATPAKIYLGHQNGSTTFAGNLQNGPGAGGLAMEKIGTGILTLTGANTHSGSTTVAAGQLNLLSNLASSSVTVADGASLVGEVTLAGLTLGATTGATVLFDPNSPEVLTVGTLTLNGPNTLEFTELPSGAGPWTALNYTSLAGAGSLNLANAASFRVAPIVTVNAGTVTVAITGTKTLNWTGLGAVTTVWDNNVNANWTDGVNPDNFFAGDTVIFGDGPSVTGVTVTSGVAPLKTIVNSDTNNYTLTSSGSGITGSGNLEKSGSSALTLVGPNTYGGQTIVSGGPLSFTSPASLGNSGLTNSIALSGGGRLNYSGATAVNLGGTRTIEVGTGGAVISFNGGTASTLTVSGAISGSAPLSFQTNGTTTGTYSLAGDNSGYTGDISVGASSTGLATLTIASAGAVPAASSITLNYPASGANGNASVLSLPAGSNLPVGTTLNLTSFLNGAISLRTQVSTAGAVTIDGPVKLAGNSICQFNPAAGSVVTLNGNVSEASPGSFVESGLNTYTNTLFLRGTTTSTSIVNGQINLPSAGSTINVTDGATGIINSTGNTFASATAAFGTLRIGADDALSTTGRLAIGQAGDQACTFDLNGFNQTVTGLEWLAPTGNLLTKGISNSHPTNTSTFTVNQATDPGVANFNGTISGRTNLVKEGAATTTLVATASTFSGNVTVNAGTLVVSGVANAAGASSTLGAANLVGKTVTVNAAGTLTFTTNNVFGNGVGNSNLPAVVVNGGTVSSTRYNVLGDVTLSGGTLTQAATDGPGTYEGYQFRGSVSASGASASVISGTNGRANHLGGNTVFNVADAAVGTDLVVSSGLKNQSGDFASASGSLTKTGSGTMALTAASTYTGGTSVNAGTLLLGNAAALGTGAAAVNAGGVLDLGGQTVTNAVTVAAGGTLAGVGGVNAAANTVSGTVSPGNSAGTISFSNTALTFAATSVLNLEIGGTSGGTFDVVGASGAITLASGCVVNVTLINGFVPALGNSFDIIADDGGVTSAATLNLPALSGGLVWDTSAFASTGTITVVNGDPVAAYVSGPPYNLTGNDALPGADPDGDGISNAMEYAFGTSPIANNGPEYRGVASTTSGALTLTYRRPLNGVSGVTYGVEFKTADLVVGNTGWTTGVLNTHYTQSVTPNGDGTTETVVINLTGAVSGKKFARVLVTY